MKRAPESFSTRRRAWSAAGVVESKRVTKGAADKAALRESSLAVADDWLRGVASEGLVAPVDYHREEKE